MSKWKHFKANLFRRSTLNKYFPKEARKKLETAVASAEKGHRGELKIVVEIAMPLDLSTVTNRAFIRAKQLFGLFNVWDTEDNSGVLIYLNLAERNLEIIADRGIHNKVGTEKWASCMEEAVKAIKENNSPVEGILFLLNEISQLLQEHFPAGPDDINELEDKPIFI